MRVVVENSPEEVARHEALMRVRWPLRELGANMLRVIRGAGKPYEIGEQAFAVAKAMQNYCDVVGHYPLSEEVRDALQMRDDEQREHWREVDYAFETVVCGALQYAASELLNQNTFRSAGRSEIGKGIRAIQEEREKERLSFIRSHRPAPRKPKK